MTNIFVALGIAVTVLAIVGLIAGVIEWMGKDDR